MVLPSFMICVLAEELLAKSWKTGLVEYAMVWKVPCTLKEFTAIKTLEICCALESLLLFDITGHNLVYFNDISDLALPCICYKTLRSAALSRPQVSKETRGCKKLLSLKLQKLSLAIKRSVFVSASAFFHRPIKRELSWKVWSLPTETKTER